VDEAAALRGEALHVADEARLEGLLAASRRRIRPEHTRACIDFARARMARGHGGLLLLIFLLRALDRLHHLLHQPAHQRRRRLTRRATHERAERRREGTLREHLADCGGDERRHGAAGADGAAHAVHFAVAIRSLEREEARRSRRRRHRLGTLRFPLRRWRWLRWAQKEGGARRRERLGGALEACNVVAVKTA